MGLYKPAAQARYAKLLSLGFVVLKQAAHSRNREWLEAELEMLHNVPSLLGEDNVERHRYYWFSERQNTTSTGLLRLGAMGRSHECRLFMSRCGVRWNR